MSPTSKRAPLASAFVRAALRVPLLTIGLWIVLGIAGVALLPSVSDVVASQNNPALRADAPTLKALKVMDKTFGTGGAKSFVLVVFENEHGLSKTDRATYNTLVRRLEKRPAYVAEVQDYRGDPALRRILVSKDGEATYLPVGLTAEIGSPAQIDQVIWLRKQSEAARTAAHGDAEVDVTGIPAKVVDMTRLATDASTKMALISIVLLLVILLAIYRRFVTVVVPLVTIGIATLCTLGALSFAGQQGMGLSSVTESFALAIVLGAGTDYSIFLISRFREEYRRTGEVREAVVAALRRIGGALLASAGTVALSSMVLHFAQLTIFSTTGPPIAFAITVTVLVSLTVTPALLLTFGKRIGPARVVTPQHFWSRVGAFVASRPAKVLLGGTAVLVLLAAFVPTIAFAYDERPRDVRLTESSRGEAALDRHFGKYSTQPDFVLVVADHDMRNSRDLALLARTSVDLTKVPGVTDVLSIAQPTGEVLDEARITTQMARLARELGSASAKIDEGRPGLDTLRSGTTALATGAGLQADGLDKAATAVPELVDGIERLVRGTDAAATGARSLRTGAAKLNDGASGLATGLDELHAGAVRTADALDLVVRVLNADPVCSLDPVCKQSRAGLRQLAVAQREGLVAGAASAATGAEQLAVGAGGLRDGLGGLATGLRQAADGQRALAVGQRKLGSGLEQLAAGSGQLADGLDRLPAGVDGLVDSTLQVGAGLGRTSSYLGTVSEQSDSSEAGGFYLPLSALKSARFAPAAKQYLSDDGRVARIQVLGSTDPSSAAAIDRYHAMKSAVRGSLSGTSLGDSDVLVTGASGGAADLNDYFVADFTLVLIAVLLTVLLLTMVVLRAIVAPLYLLASVILSYAAAVGAGVLVFQHLLGQNMLFTAPIFAFVVLVAVGADYNILLMSRMRESRGSLSKSNVGRAVTATGPVITSAGIIFASTFVPLTTSSLATIAQLGFIVMIGLILDTFIVRTLIVPACAALLGDRSWWPGLRPGARTAEQPSR